MDVGQQIARIRIDAEALARAAEAGPLDTQVPTCPEWDVETLVRHIGSVHRWAATIVRERRTDRPRLSVEGPTGRTALLAWYRDGYEELTATFEAASEEAVFWYWGPAPNALAFWCRRQANETAVHRRDAEAARGPLSPLETPNALDALDEWLTLASLRSSATPGGGRIVRLAPTDGDRVWFVRLGDRVEVLEAQSASDCALTGTASDLFLWSMNRRGTDGIAVSGDSALVQVWADSMRF